MSAIEWQETHELRPQEQSLAEACRVRGIDPDGLPVADLVVLVEDEVLNSLHDFLSEETTREHGGVLVGKPYWDAQRQQHFVVIHRAIPAFATQGSPVHLQFTAETWDYIAGIIEEELPGMAVVGWHHSHPNLGVFMSGTDRATQAAFYNHPWCVAIVVDPIAHRTGWFAGKECTPMRPEQIAVFKSHVEEEKVEPAHSIDVSAYRYGVYTSRSLRWLLPATLMVFFLAGALWFLARNRFQSGGV